MYQRVSKTTSKIAILTPKHRQNNVEITQQKHKNNADLKQKYYVEMTQK